MTTTTDPTPEVGGRDAASVRRTAADVAREHLRELILAGDFAPGARINEVVLAQSMGISRGPLREAIQRLASEGLLQAIPHRGAFVSDITPAVLTDLYELRIAVECHAVRLGTHRASQPEIDTLGEMVRSTSSVLREPGRSYPSDVDLHLALVSLADSPSLLATAKGVNTRIHLARAKSAHDPRRARTAHYEHKAVVDAIVAGDALGAARMLEQHLRQSLESAAGRIAPASAAVQR